MKVYTISCFDTALCSNGNSQLQVASKVVLKMYLYSVYVGEKKYNTIRLGTVAFYHNFM